MRLRWKRREGWRMDESSPGRVEDSVRGFQRRRFWYERRQKARNVVKTLPIVQEQNSPLGAKLAVMHLSFLPFFSFHPVPSNPISPFLPLPYPPGLAQKPLSYPHIFSYPFPLSVFSRVPSPLKPFSKILPLSLSLIHLSRSPVFMAL